MRIIHSIGDLKKEVEGKGSFLTGDGEGGYVCFPNQPVNNSNYQGWLQFDNQHWTLYKTIENIYIPEKSVNTVHNKLSHVERDSGPTTERFYLTEEALLYEVFNHKGFVSIDFDFRHIFDFSTEGRIYEINPREGGLLIVSYKKYTDNSLKQLDHEKFLAIKNVKDYWTSGEWKERSYEYDQKRNSHCNFYIYGTLNIKMENNDNLVFAHANTEEEAVNRANSAWHNFHEIKQRKEAGVQQHFHDLESNVAANSLYSLKVDLEDDNRGTGIFAGFPWFFQFWRRDEMVALKALMLLDEDVIVKDILMNYLHSLRPDGWMNNKNVESDLESADSTGWLFLRFHDYLKHLKDKNEIFDHFTKEELYKVLGALQTATTKIMENHVENGLVVNNKLETWMDTFVEDDYREGVRIEIQALQLRMYKFGAFLSKLLGESSEKYGKLEEELRKTVKKNFYKNGKLADGVLNGGIDFTQRPNIFLAYYAYPELLPDEQWKKAFDNALKELWLDWGGLSSISKNDPLFKDKYTGETNESYHRGDSWYYVNNIAAMCMANLDSKKYAEKIDTIKKASAKEMLTSGFLGHCSEISSAKEMHSEGARCQAWSAATLIELFN